MKNIQLKRVFDFIETIEKNNNREWYTDNKSFYLDAKNDFEEFLEFVGNQLEIIDPSFHFTKAKDYTFRIYRDVRFSKNKAPYKNHFGAFLANGGRKSPMAGYYIHLEPGASFIGGGVYRPDKDYLKVIRQEMYYSFKDYEKIVLNDSFKEYFPTLMPDKLKTGPRDFPKDCDAIEWLKYKSFAVGHSISKEEIVSANFAKDVINGFSTLKPMNDFLNNAIIENV
ncbi:MAG: DUF2461 domain-containing protein [Bacteroidetes bacterium]|nr:MAG: DUF2461 domain-containing protein [Bacteroidota bacterium]